jgi:Holliday junction resolvase RusA-like endonuclease
VISLTAPHFEARKPLVHCFKTKGDRLLKFDFKPMTFNNIYASSRTGRRFLIKEGKEYKAKIEAVSFNHFADLKDCEDALRFTMIVRGPWLTNKGRISKVLGDLDGFAKVAIDSICKPLNINDAVITEIVMRKEFAVNWSFEVDLVRAWSINPLETSKLS